MEDFLNIKLDNMHFIQRSEFSKITVSIDNKIICCTNSIQELPENLKEILTDALEMKSNFKEYFEYDFIMELGCALITKYIGKNIKHIVFPEDVNGLDFLIGSDIFRDNSEIKSIYLSDNIKDFGKNFCRQMPNLEKVYLGKNIKEIPYHSFAGCKNLNSINLENVKAIFNNAFEGCKNLKNVNLDNAEIITSNAFSNCEELSSIYLPKIKDLSDNCFKECFELKEVILGNNLTEIGEFAFDSCYGLKKVKLPESLELLNKGVFYNCFSLQKIDLPENLLSIKNLVFYNSGLEGEITFPSKLETIGDKAFVKTKIINVNISKDTEYNQSSFPLDALCHINKYDQIKTENKIPKEPER